MPRPSKDVHILIPGACDYVILYGKSDLADVIKDLPGGLNAITRGPIKEGGCRVKAKEKKGDVLMEPEGGVMCLEDGGRGH